MTAARIAHADEVRAAVYQLDPQQLITRLGLRARRNGSRFTVLCPAHDEKTPSCHVTVRNGMTVWHCKGCGEGGDAIALIAAKLDLDIRRDFRRVLVEAALVAGHASLADEIDSAQTRISAPIAKKRAAEPPPPLPDEEPKSMIDDATFDALVRPVLHVGRLDDSPIAADVTRYLASRGVLDEARRDTWAALAPPAFSGELVRLLRQEFGAEAVAASGLVRDDAFEYASHRLVIPWRDAAGHVITLQRRSLDAAARSKYVFPSGRSARWPYGVEQLTDAARDVPVALVEGAVDTLALRALQRARGIERIVLGVPGTGTWRPEWTELLHGRRVALAFDRDEAGDRYAKDRTDELRKVASALTRERPPAGCKDWADMVVAEHRGARA